MESVTHSECVHFYNIAVREPAFNHPCLSLTLGKNATLTLLYYAGYLTMTVCHFSLTVISVVISAKARNRFKIPNLEVMTDWARWVIGDVSWNDILEPCVEGPVSDFETRWPDYMQSELDPKLVTKTRGAVSPKTPEKICHVFVLGLIHFLRAKGWEVSAEPRAGGGYLDIHLIHRRKGMAILIELKSSEKEGDLRRDADKALEQIIKKNYRNPVGLPNVRVLREYGIAAFHLSSLVKGRYLELNGQNQWVEKSDPRMSVQ
jgi:hypothetical protein